MLTIAEILRFHTVCHVITYSSNSAESSNHPPQQDKVRRNPVRRKHGTSLQPEQICFLSVEKQYMWKINPLFHRMEK